MNRDETPQKYDEVRDKNAKDGNDGFVNGNEQLMSEICGGDDIPVVDLQKYDEVEKNADGRDHSGSKKRPLSCNPCEICYVDPPVHDIVEKIRSRRRSAAVKRRYSEPGGIIQHLCRFC